MDWCEARELEGLTRRKDGKRKGRLRTGREVYVASLYEKCHRLNRPALSRGVDRHVWKEECTRQGKSKRPRTTPTS